jgi:class III poly(R)-hydroxyalkanoic acid synthase PhaE subunit
MPGFAESSEAWTKTWLEMQKQYMDAWMKLAGADSPWREAASPFKAAGANPWADAFEQWSKLFGNAMPASAGDVSKRLFDVGKSYLGMSEGFWKFMQQGKDMSEWTHNWQEAMQNALAQPAGGQAFPGGAADPWAGFANLWGLPVNNWQRMAYAFSPFPGEMEKSFRQPQLPAASHMNQALRQFLDMPPVGYTREWQEQAQEWGNLYMEYNQTVQAFGVLLGKVVQRALELFGKRVQDKINAGESFEGLRPMYNLWIECGEDAYAEQVATADFPRLQAEMVNALMRMKRHEQRMVEEVLTAMNMPTRSELNTTHQRVYQLQQQVCRLREQLEDMIEAADETPRKPAAAAPKKAAAKKKTASTAKRRTQS